MYSYEEYRKDLLGVFLEDLKERIKNVDEQEEENNYL